MLLPKVKLCKRLRTVAAIALMLLLAPLAHAEPPPISALQEFLSLSNRLQGELEAIEQDIARDVLALEGNTACLSPEAMKNIQERIAEARRTIEARSQQLEAGFQRLVASLPPGGGEGAASRTAGQQALAILNLTRERLNNSANRLKTIESQIGSVAVASGDFTRLEEKLNDCKKTINSPKACILPQADTTITQCKDALKEAALLDSVVQGGGDQPIRLPGCPYSVSIPQAQRLVSLREELKVKIKECLKITACPTTPFTETGYFTGKVTLEIPNRHDLPWSNELWPLEELPIKFTKTCSPPKYPQCGPKTPSPRIPSTTPPKKTPPPSLSGAKPAPGYEESGVCSKYPPDPITGLTPCLRRLPYVLSSGNNLEPDEFVCHNFVFWWKVFMEIVNQANAKAAGFMPFETASLALIDPSNPPHHTLGMICQPEPDKVNKKCCFYDATTSFTYGYRDEACDKSKRDSDGKKVPLCWKQEIASKIQPTQEAIDALQHEDCCSGICRGPGTKFLRNPLVLDDTMGDEMMPLLLDPESKKFKEFQTFIERMTGIKIKVLSTRRIPGLGYTRVELEISMPRGMCVQGCTLPKVPSAPASPTPRPVIRADVPATKVSAAPAGSNALVKLAIASAKLETIPLLCGGNSHVQDTADQDVESKALNIVDDMIAALVPYVDDLRREEPEDLDSSSSSGSEDLDTVEQYQINLESDIESDAARRALATLESFFKLPWPPQNISSIEDNARREQLVREFCQRQQRESDDYSAIVEAITGEGPSEDYVITEGIVSTPQRPDFPEMIDRQLNIKNY